MKDIIHKKHNLYILFDINFFKMTEIEKNALTSLKWPDLSRSEFLEFYNEIKANKVNTIKFNLSKNKFFLS